MATAKEIRQLEIEKEQYVTGLQKYVAGTGRVVSKMKWSTNKFLETLIETLSFKKTCLMHNLSPEDVYGFIQVGKTNPRENEKALRFGRAVEYVFLIAVDDVEKVTFDRAHFGSHHHDALRRLILQANRPEKYGEKLKVSHDHHVSLTDEIAGIAKGEIMDAEYKMLENKEEHPNESDETEENTETD